MYQNWGVRKYKVRLNAHGGQRIHGVSYWKSSALVVMFDDHTTYPNHDIEACLEVQAIAYAKQR